MTATHNSTVETAKLAIVNLTCALFAWKCEKRRLGSSTPSEIVYRCVCWLSRKFQCSCYKRRSPLVSIFIYSLWYYQHILAKRNWFQSSVWGAQKPSALIWFGETPPLLRPDAMLAEGTKLKSFPASLCSFSKPIFFSRWSLLNCGSPFCLFRAAIWLAVSTSRHITSGHSAKDAPNTATPPNRWEGNWCFMQLYDCGRSYEFHICIFMQLPVFFSV